MFITIWGFEKVDTEYLRPAGLWNLHFGVIFARAILIPFITNRSYNEKQNHYYSAYRHYCCFPEFLRRIPQQIRMPGQPNGQFPV